ncbi:MAG: class I SAM-dependent methyltransferase family protein [Haloarculaceae archaeon]
MSVDDGDSERDDGDADGGDDSALAAVVPKERGDAAIAAIKAEGVYDATRKVAEFDADTIAVPVTDPPETGVLKLVRQPGTPRLRDLADHLRERGWTDAEVERAPASWAVLGTVVLVDIGDTPRPGEVGEALLDLHGGADTVLARGGISGAHREPDVEVVAGTGDTETVHTEHGIRYAMDLAEVMFSPGNKAERARMGEVVDPGERVVDMFAGIGYFTLPMARAGAEVTAIERNPTAFRYLLENVRLNGVSESVRPYRADCRDVLGVAASSPRSVEVGGTGPAREDAETDVRADRVVMGYYDAFEYLDSALGTLDPGGTIHLHEATPDPLVFERPIERVETAAAERGRAVEILGTRRVKTHSEGVVHVVVDARVD